MSESRADNELFACRLTLRPLREGALLPFSGRAIHAWWLETIRADDPDLAERLHAGSARRPFTCAGLEGLPVTGPGTLAPVSPERTYGLRLTAWERATVARLAALVATPPTEVRLAGIPFAVVAATVDREAPPATFAGLAARYLLPPDTGDERPRDVTLRLLTATSFRQPATPAGRPAPIPFPLPALVWGGLFDRWQAASPAPLDPATREALTTRVAIGRFEGRSQRVLLPGLGDPGRQVGATGGQWIVGFVGHCAYWWPRRDGYLGGVLRLLAAFAAYSGVGYGTAYGLGQARAAE